MARFVKGFGDYPPILSHKSVCEVLVVYDRNSDVLSSPVGGNGIVLSSCQRLGEHRFLSVYDAHATPCNH